MASQSTLVFNIVVEHCTGDWDIMNLCKTKDTLWWVHTGIGRTAIYRSFAVLCIASILNLEATSYIAAR